MGRSRYEVYESIHPHFLTLTVLYWILLFINKNNITTILEQLAFYKKAHKKTSEYQVWQEEIQPKLIQDEKTMIQKIEYVHNNPVKREYVDEGVYWRYSSARDYDDIRSLLEIERAW